MTNLYGIIISIAIFTSVKTAERIIEKSEEGTLWGLSLWAIISGITITSVTLLANTAVAGIAIAAGGLGGIAQQAYESFDSVTMWSATILLTLIVFAIQIPGDYISRKIDKR